MSNTAQLSFDVDGAGRAISSNTVSIIVTERLDTTVVADAPSVIALQPGDHAIGFRVANSGNGRETFTLVAATTGDGASGLRIAADEDGNGVYDPAIDRELSPPQLTLDSGRDAHVFVIVGGVQRQGQVSLTATADTGTGAPGTLFAGKGESGGDAVVGATGASATARTIFAAGTDETARLIKSQTVTAPDGSARAVRGAVITYALEARFDGPVEDVEIADAIPSGTAYVADSLTLDGAALSDTADADSGRFDGQAVTVSLGDMPGTSIRTIRFQVTIQ